MGIISTARTAFKASLASFKATVDAGNEWLSKFDAQDATAPADFAATKQAQYSTFVAGLPEPTIADQDDPTP